MPPTPEHRCEPCEATWAQAERPAVARVGGVVLALAGLAAVGMLVLIHQGQTDLGGACAVAAMALLGLGVWLQSRAQVRCPACKRPPCDPAASPQDEA